MTYIRSIFILSITLFVVSCASGPRVTEEQLERQRTANVIKVEVTGDEKLEENVPGFAMLLQEELEKQYNANAVLTGPEVVAKISVARAGHPKDNRAYFGQGILGPLNKINGAYASGYIEYYYEDGTLLKSQGFNQKTLWRGTFKSNKVEDPALFLAEELAMQIVRGLRENKNLSAR